MRSIGLFIIIGGLLLVISTLLHPLVYNPWSFQWVIPEVIKHYWMWDHIFMLIGVSIWLTGLAIAPFAFKLEKVYIRMSLIFYVVSLTIWVMILSMELGVIPPLGHDVLSNSQDYLTTLWTVLFSYGLFSGYVAMIFAYLGILTFALSWIKSQTSPFFGKWGIFSGAIGVIGIIITLLVPNRALTILVITTLPPFSWSILLGYRCLKKE